MDRLDADTYGPNEISSLNSCQISGANFPWRALYRFSHTKEVEILHSPQEGI